MGECKIFILIKFKKYEETILLKYLKFSFSYRSENNFVESSAVNNKNNIYIEISNNNTKSFDILATNLNNTFYIIILIIQQNYLQTCI